MQKAIFTSNWGTIRAFGFTKLEFLKNMFYRIMLTINNTTMNTIDDFLSGYHEFKKIYHLDHISEFTDLANNGQKPEIAMICCSDSRIDPAIIFKTKPGKLFVIRNVANLVPPFECSNSHDGTSAALEYAVEHLRVKHIVVLGHAFCGGIQSLLTNEQNDPHSSSFVSTWMSIARQASLRVKATMPEASDEEQSRTCEKCAIPISLENLMSFPFVMKGVANGSLRLHGWYIDIEKGDLSGFDSKSQQFHAFVGSSTI